MTDLIAEARVMSGGGKDKVRQFVDVGRGISDEDDWTDELTHRRLNADVEHGSRPAVSLHHAVLHLHQSRVRSIDDRGQPDRIAAPTRAWLRRCHWPRPCHAARPAALTRS